MTVSALVDLAVQGELKQLGVSTGNEATVVGYINLGLIELYKRFGLSTKEQIIKLGYDQDVAADGTVTSSSTANPIKTEYILNGDVMSIIEVFNQAGEYYVLNDENDINSIFTTSYNTLQVANVLTGTYISVIYNASPTLITYNASVYTPVNVPLQDSLLEALLHYVGYRAHGSMNGAINAESNSHYMRFEASCKRAIDNGWVTADNALNSRFTEKGYV